MKAITSEGAKVLYSWPPDLTDTSQEAWQYALDNPDKLGNAPEITDEVIRLARRFLRMNPGASNANRLTGQCRYAVTQMRR